jgi:endonuclease/exonuclease/phosphatase family metal-dependent hydrolase
MPTPLRIATFNVENLFSRARAINFQNNERGTEILEQIKQFEALLDQPVYDQAQLADQYDALKEYISVENEMGEFFGNTVSGKRRVIATGRDDWRGRIEFRRDTFSDATRRNTARVIKSINPDICCLIEVESRPVLRSFCTDVLSTSGSFKRFPHAMCIDGNDPRGIDVSVISRVPIGILRSHVDDMLGKTQVFPRDCLEVELIHPDGFTIWLLINHFTSKLGPAADTAKKRKRQAERVAEILQGYDLTRQYVVVAGDFNDTPDSAALAPLLHVPNLFDVLAESLPNPADRWTYHFKKNVQIDYLLVSKPLRDALKTVGIERRGMWKVGQYSGGQIQIFDTITRYAESASDHGAVWADFLIG